MATTASSVKDKASTAANRVKDDVVDGAQDIADRAKTTGERVSRDAEAMGATLTRTAEDLAGTVTDTLKSVGVDTDHMVDVAKEQATDLQRLIMEEIQERPFRALGVAAAIGLFVGFIAAR